LTDRPIYLLDTNTVSYLFKEQSPAIRKAWADAEKTSRIVISTVTAAELLFGLEKNPSSIRNREAVQRLLANVEVLPWDLEAARAYAVLRQQLSTNGKTLETHDLMIAAHARSLRARLVTRDKAFEHLEGRVTVVNWATDLK